VNAFNDIKIEWFAMRTLGSRVAISPGNYFGKEEHPMPSPIKDVYEQFVAEHYAEKPLRHPVHVEAVIGAAGVRPTDVGQEFWKELRPEWLSGMSPLPFTGPKSRKANAQYRRLCELKGVAP